MQQRLASKLERVEPSSITEETVWEMARNPRYLGLSHKELCEVNSDTPDPHIIAKSQTGPLREVRHDQAVFRESRRPVVLVKASQSFANTVFEGTKGMDSHQTFTRGQALDDGSVWGGQTLQLSLMPLER